MEESLENMQLNMQMIRKRKSNLIVRAPIDGELGLLDVVLGQSIASGTKIGQINSVGTYKVEAQIDEHYIDRVVDGLEATFERQGETYSTVIRKVYPEVRDGKFKADFKFEISSSMASSPTTSAPARPTTSTSSSASPKKPSSSRAAPSTRKPAENGSTSSTRTAPRPSSARSASAARIPSTTKCSRALSPAKR